MNLKRLFLWATIFLALLVYVVFFEKPELKKDTKNIRQQDEFAKVLLLDQEDIKEIQLSREGKKARLVKKGSAWEVAPPARAGIQKELLEGLVSALTDAVNLGVADENPLNLEQFGLVQPSITARIFLRDKAEPVALLIGCLTPSGVSVYAKIESEKKVFMTGTYLTFSIKMFMDNIQ